MDHDGEVEGSQRSNRLFSLGDEEKRDQMRVLKLYDEWGLQSYDQDMEREHRKAPALFADAISREYIGDRATAKILDVAAGTGLLAEQLLQEGFARIDALDPSSGMLEAARQKECYQNYICGFMEDVSGSLEKDHYDIVCSLGAIGPGHLKTESLKQMHSVTKPGGLLGICGRKGKLDSDPEYNLHEGILQMVESSKIVIIRNTVIREYCRPEHDDWHGGVLVLMRKLSNV